MDLCAFSCSMERAGNLFKGFRPAVFALPLKSYFEHTCCPYIRIS